MRWVKNHLLVQSGFFSPKFPVNTVTRMALLRHSDSRTMKTVIIKGGRKWFHTTLNQTKTVREVCPQELSAAHFLSHPIIHHLSLWTAAAVPPERSLIDASCLPEQSRKRRLPLSALTAGTRRRRARVDGLATLTQPFVRAGGNKSCGASYFHINSVAGCVCDKFPQGAKNLFYLSTFLT